MPGTLVLLRHGESGWNQANLFCGWCDIHLTDKGVSQAVSSAKLLKENNYSPDILFTSKLTRSIQTTNVLLQELDCQWVDVVKNWRLNERHYGQLQGQSKNKILKEFGEEKYMYWRRNFQGCPPLIEDLDSEFASIKDKRYLIDTPLEDLPRGESLEMVLKRLLPFYTSSIEPYLLQDKCVFVVTHGSIVRALVKHLYSIDDDSIAGINIPNGIPMVVHMKQDESAVDDKSSGLVPVSQQFEYLDPHTAAIEAEKVARQGFDH